MTAVLRIIPFALLAGVTVALFLGGWFVPVEFPDTSGYELAAASANPWAEPRHPLYGWLLWALAYLGASKSHVPAIQFGFHLIAVAVLYGASRSLAMDRRAAGALAASAIVSQSFFIWGRAVLPEILSVSLLLLAIAAVMGAARQRWFWPLAMAYGVVLGLSYTLRPIMLPAVLVLPLLFAALSVLSTREWPLRRMLMLVVIGLMPFLGQSAYRLQSVGDFNMVSFGGFGISGMTAQMLTPEAVERLPATHQPLALQILQAKDRAVEERVAMPLFRNSTGQRSFQTTALDGFDTLARNFDEIMWGQISRLKGADESWVAFNARLGAFNGAVLRALPERWLMWSIGATSRLVGRVTVYNAAFLLGCLAFLILALVNIARTGTALAGASGPSWSALILVVAAWILSTVPLTVIAAFPALRYTDTAGMLLTAIPLYGLLLALRNTNSDAPL